MTDRPPPASVQLRSLPLMEKRLVGGPVPERLLAAYFAVGLAGWVAAAVAAIRAAPWLARGFALGEPPVLAVHLLALGALPFAVAGASCHLLPVMLRHDLPWAPGLWLALGLLLGGPVVAFGVAHWSRSLTWAGVALLTAGVGVIVAELGWVVVRAPADRTLIASRAGIALSLLHAVLALCAGALIFDTRRDLWSVGFDRWLLVHLHLALVGWIALLIVAVGRNLAPMLAQAPAAPRRRRPVDELLLAAGLWILVGGIATASRIVTVAGALVLVATLARFALLLVGTYRSRRAALDAPLGHLLTGALFLAQGVILGLLAALGIGGPRVVVAYVVVLAAGWAAGVVIGHVPKLLSLSVWVWWPPGPRPKQAALYPRRLMLLETAAFAAAVELMMVGVLTASASIVRTGAVLLLASALLAAAAAADVIRRRSVHRSA